MKKTAYLSLTVSLLAQNCLAGDGRKLNLRQGCENGRESSQLSPGAPNVWRVLPRMAN